jgi:signal transduction histidine kinase
MEELLHLPDGSTLRSVASPHPFGGVLLTYEDVTDRLSLESSYNTLIEVQSETLDNLYEGVAVYGADGRLKLSNPAFARIWDLPESLLGGEPHVRELVARSRDFFEVSDAEWQGLMETRVARATEPEPRSGRRERADGSIIDWTLVPLPDGASLFTFLDVTDSIRVERALRERAEAMETADRLKSEFVANISYELRTPLNAIVGFAEILENQFFGELNERQLEYSRGIVQSSERLTVLINDILDLASIEAGYLQLDVAPVDLHGLLASVEALAHERAHNQNIDLKLECAADIGTLEADGRRLKQALFNLLSNAIKFTPEGGAVTVSAERAGGEVRLAVTDTGSGIRPEDIDRVFGKFETGGGQSGQSGAGLGLSLVKSLIEMHGGWVGLDSKPGAGTKVVCHVPLEQPPPAPPES